MVSPFLGWTGGGFLGWRLVFVHSCPTVGGSLEKILVLGLCVSGGSVVAGTDGPPDLSLNGRTTVLVPVGGGYVEAGSSVLSVMSPRCLYLVIRARVGGPKSVISPVILE